MAIEPFLSSSFDLKVVTGITDAQQAIDAIDSALTTVTARLPIAWTRQSAGRWKSPPNAFNQFIVLICTRLSASIMTVQMEDGWGHLTTQRGLNVLPTLTLHFGSQHFAMEAGAHGGFGAVLDLDPEVQDAHTKYPVFSNCAQTGGVDDNTNTTGNVQVKNSTNSAFASATLGGITFCQDEVANQFMKYSNTGIRLWWPPLIYGDDGGVGRLRGKIPQCLMVDNGLASGTTIVVPIDEITTGKFRVLAMQSDLSIPHSYAFRVP